MKKYIYPVLLLTALMMGFTSCADNFDEDDKATYPTTRPAFGVWGNDYNASEGPYADPCTYEVNFTENINGDSIVNISMYYKAADMPLNTLNGRISEYDPVSGMTTVDFPSSDLGLFLVDAPLPARAYMTYDRHASALRVEIYLIYQNQMLSANDYIGTGAFSVTKYAYPINVLGYWEDLATGIVLQLNADGTAGILDGYDVVPCTFSYDKNNGTMAFHAAASAAEGEAAEPEVFATAYFNENSQLKFSLKGAEEVLMDRLAEI